MKKIEGNSEFLLVPLDRIGAIIGKRGLTRREIELKTQTLLKVDSTEGEVEIFQKGSALLFFKATRVIKAIARGFAPEKAFRLINEEVFFELIDLKDILGKNESNMKAKKGRVIGAKGKAREEIESESGANISVYGKTIGIIGTENEIFEAKKAVNMLLGGASHTAVYTSIKKDFENQDFEL